MSWVGASLGSCTQSVPPICFKKYWRSGFLLNPDNWDTLFRRTRPPWRRGPWPSPPQRPLRPPACRRHAWRTKMVRPPLASTSLRACQGRPRMTRTTGGKSSRHPPPVPTNTGAAFPAHRAERRAASRLRRIPRSPRPTQGPSSRGHQDAPAYAHAYAPVSDAKRHFARVSPSRSGP